VVTKAEHLLNQVASACSILGIDEVIDVLVNAQSRNSDHEIKEIRDGFIDIICKEFLITKQELFYQKTYGNRTEVLAIYCFFLNKIFNLSSEYIGSLPYVNKKKITIYKYIKCIENLQPTNKLDKELLDKMIIVKNKLEILRNLKNRSKCEKE
jgi:hypothetical protein